jgi:VanZ family protein
MQNPAASSASLPSTSEWSNRILIAAVAGILFLTLFPFRFAFATRLPGDASPFFLASSPKVAKPLDVFLNVLLFIPFGFGISAVLRHRGTSGKATFFVTLLAGALFSYGIEFLQIYIPSRDSGWEDVITNSIGAVLGSIIFDRIGRAALLYFSRCEEVLNRTLTLGRAALVVPIYFALWFTVSVPLQKETRLSNWDPDCQLLVGNEASGRLGTPWKGAVLRLQFWNRAVPDEVARNLTAGDSSGAELAGLLTDFDFSGSVPLEDRKKLLPALSWTPAPPAHEAPNAVILDGKAWLSSRLPVSDLVREIQGANQFAVRVRCSPTDLSGSDRRIVSISKSSGISDLSLRAENAYLVFWFRNPLSVQRSLLAWYIPNVFVPNQPRDILFSYDGSNLSLYIDGKKEPRAYLLGPGTGLAELVRRVIPSELQGYNDIYYAAVFLPGGILLGIACRCWAERPFVAPSLILLGTCLPPVILESVLVSVSGRAVSRANVLFSLLLIIAGAVWINADRRARI